MTTVLESRNLRAGYGKVTVVNDLNIEVNTGEVVALLGANGAGKTTTLLTLSGLIPSLGGTVLLNDQVTRASASQRARNGLGFVTEERSVFVELSTADNLRLARGDRNVALELFPQLRERLKLSAGLLSGGEQQMLSLARALSRSPSVLLADELSLGLAPLAVDRLLLTVRKAADEGMGALLVEQHVKKALAYSDRVYVMSRGEIVLSGPATELRGRLTDIERSYLSAEGRA